MNTEMDAFRALIERAHAYYRETYRREGYPPSRFRVTHEEERLLRIYGSHNVVMTYSSDGQEIHLMGMRVYLPERQPCQPGCGTKVHYKGFGGRLPMSEELTPYEAATLEFCETPLLMTGQRDIPCPCGDVIWVFIPDPWQEAQRINGPGPADAVDSDHTSFDEWAAEVEALVKEVERRG